MTNHIQEVKGMTDEQLQTALIAMANVLMQGMGRQPLKKRQNAAKFRRAIIEEQQRRAVK